MNGLVALAVIVAREPSASPKQCRSSGGARRRRRLGVLAHLEQRLVRRASPYSSQFVVQRLASLFRAQVIVVEVVGHSVLCFDAAIRASSSAMRASSAASSGVTG